MVALVLESFAIHIGYIIYIYNRYHRKYMNMYYYVKTKYYHPKNHPLNQGKIPESSGLLDESGLPNPYWRVNL